MTYKGNSYKDMVVSANRKIHLSIEEAILHKDNSIEMHHKTGNFPLGETDLAAAVSTIPSQSEGDWYPN